jgi:hypothetical protein
MFRSSRARIATCWGQPLPGPTMLSLVLVFAAYAFVDGMLAIIAAVRGVSRNERWGYLILEGITGIIAAVAAVLWPGITVLAFIYLVAGWDLCGLSMIPRATECRRLNRNVDLIVERPKCNDLHPCLSGARTW